MVIDAHVHFWNYHPVKDAWITDTMKFLKQDFLPADLLPLIENNKTDGCVAVQADQSEHETGFLLELAAAYQQIRGIVGWVDLRADNIEERLQYFSGFPLVKGFRHIVEAEPAGFLLGDSFQRGISALSAYGFTYDILVNRHQLNDVLKFADRFPDQRMVIDHCAKPGIRKGEIRDWDRQIREIAQQPNLYCKLSGLLTEAAWEHWNAATFAPFLDTVFDAFGCKRLMYGSDWPVMLLSGRYARWKELLENYMKGFSDDDRAAVFGLTAKDFYSIQ